MLTDRYGLTVSTASSEARDAYVEGCEAKLTAFPGAVEAFDRAIAADPRFALTVTPAPRAADFAAGRVMVLDDPAPLAAPLVAPATAFVRAGDGLLVILGPRGAAESWSPAWRALLGGAPGVPQ